MCKDKGWVGHKFDRLGAVTYRELCTKTILNIWYKTYAVFSNYCTIHVPAAAAFQGIHGNYGGTEWNCSKLELLKGHFSFLVDGEMASCTFNGWCVANSFPL